jgi:hypothetical protein
MKHSLHKPSRFAVAAKVLVAGLFLLMMFVVLDEAISDGRLLIPGDFVPPWWR